MTTEPGRDLLSQKRIALVHEGAMLAEAARALLEERFCAVEVVELPLASLDKERVAGAAALVLIPDLPGPFPSLDRALMAAVRGVDRVIAVARELGSVPVVLASSLEVLGAREGSLFEGEPSEPPYPLARARGTSFWDLDDELARAQALVEETEARLGHADVRSRLEEQAKRALGERCEPTRGRALDDKRTALEAAERQALLVDKGRERARDWGFLTTRGWVLALCEQRLEASGLPFTVVRTPPLGAALRHPAKGALPEEPALEGVLERAREGAVRLSLDDDAIVELLPVDLAAAALVVALAGVVHGSAPHVLHASATPKRPLLARRLTDLVDLHLRKREGKTGLALAPVDLAPVAPADQSAATALPARLLARALRRASAEAERRLPVPPAAKALARELTARVTSLEGSAPLDVDPRLLTWSSGQRLRAHNLPATERRVFGAKAAPLFDVTALDWRRWLLDVHLPALSERISGRGDDDEATPLARYDNLLQLLEEATERKQSAPALSLFQGTERVDVSYRELYARARAVARRLEEAGLERGERVLLAGDNHPSWAIACFGVLFAGGVLVPVDPALSEEQVANVARRARVRLSIVDKKARAAFGEALLSVHTELGGGPLLDLALVTVSGPEGGLAPDEIAPDELASLLFTSGTTGDPKGVMLSHANFASLIASLGSVFDMTRGDRLLSVLPLHHTFEFSCGLLLPLAAGAQVFYPDERTGERVLYALKEGRVTAMVGVPALWQLLERRLRSRLDELSGLEKGAFDVARALNRALKERLSVDMGALLFKRVHDELGGHLRTLISGGAALPKETFELFASLGLPLAEGYGLTEAAPVLSVAEAGPGALPGTVGKPIPGVELALINIDDKGVGEVVARGGNVMRGYFENEAATREVLDDDGWLKTGDLGRFDDEGRLVIVGRAKDVVVTSSGENVYLDDVEARLTEIPGVKELSLVGVDDPRGGERLALVFVPEDVEGDDEKAKASLDEALRRLPLVFRPSVVRRYDDDALPRTATLKVKRKDVRAWLAARLEGDDAERPADDAPDVPLMAVRAAVALTAGLDPKKISPETRLAQDLGFDSLMWVELAGALEPLFGRPDPEALYRCETVRELERFVATLDPKQAGARRRGDVKRDGSTRGEPRKLPVPAVVKAPARRALALAQRELYRALFDTEVEGRAHIPYNRPCIVVANHSSHLDTGLVKYALGRYGEALTPLAAKDYFFEGHPLKVAFFEHLTNLEPIDRESGSGLAFEQAVGVAESGRVLLLFPEGTRREDGTLGAFKPLVGRLSLKTGVPVLPMHLQGAYEALPRGARVPKPGSLKVRIGPPLFAEQLARLTAHLAPVEAARAATGLIREAVVALSEGHPLDLDEVDALDDEGRPLRRRTTTTRARERVPS